MKGTIGYDDLLEKIKKTGKEVRLLFTATARCMEVLIVVLGSLWRDS